MEIVIAGASGFIGSAAIPELLRRFPDAHITALSRRQQADADPKISWKACDLFSLKAIEEAIPAQVDLAFYLVHSMGPTAQLDQGTFADYDLILADNFARAMKRAQVKHLIYLGGLIPQVGVLSPHLRSRLEVEEAFREYDLPVTVFRAGLILGDGGSSTQILFKLVKRLPVMICPAWTQTLTSPVDLGTVLAALISSAMETRCIRQVYDLVGCEPITYLEMMRETSRQMGKRRYFFSVPFFTPTLSRLWVSVVTNTSRNLVYPLIQSLAHPMLAREEYYYSDSFRGKTYGDILSAVSFKTHAMLALFRFSPAGRTVRSVQRLPLPEGKDARWVMERYTQWVPKFLFPFVRVETKSSEFRFFFLKILLLELLLSEERSSSDRQLFYMGKGALIANENRGRLEFRQMKNRRFILAAIHDYRPSLPWFIYKYTQALVHLSVMRAFGRALYRMQ